MKKLFKHKYFWFVTFIIVVSVAYNYHEIIFKRPDSFHTWRQTDCTSLALNYYQLDLPFLEPQTHNLLGNNGKGVGEFPIIYYIVGKLYKVFGYHEFIFRIVNTLIFFLGLFYLFKLSYLLLKSTFYSLAVVGIAFSSPLIVFYANNFLPDVPALSLSYIAWYYVLLYIRQKQIIHFILVVLIFSLAGVLKITALMSLCVLICTMMYELVFVNKEKRLILSNSLLPLAISVLPFILFFVWLSYAHYYQTINENKYFSLDWDPFWIEEAKTNYYIFRRLTESWGWLPDFYKTTLLWAFLGGIVLLFKRGISYFWRASIFAFICGNLIFIGLYFSALNHHDYYLINLFGIFPLITLFVLHTLKQNFLLKNALTKIAVVILIFLSIQHTDKRMHHRHRIELNDEIRPFYKINDEYLNSIGLTFDKKLLYDGDNFFNGVLYLINRFGWSRAHEKFDPPETFEKYKSRADFLIVLGSERAEKENYKNLKLVDIYEETIYIYSLK
jgi:hypothetical protein